VIKTGKHPIDVLIVGAGPSGTVLAIDLIRRGLNVRIIDKAAHAFEGSRAKGVQPRTLEVLEDLGALDDVLAGGDTYPLMGIHIGPLTIPWRIIPKKQPTADVPFPSTWLVPQYRTDRALHARLHALGASVEFGKELVSLAANEASVTATVQTDEGLEQIEARYVAGADGGSSKVRRLLGIGFDGSTDEQDRMIIADAVVTGLSRDRWHVWPRGRGRFVAACPLPDSDLFQWMIRLAPGEEPLLNREALAKRIHKETGNSRIELDDVRWTSVFRPNVRIAARYRIGRIFLLGDAAHVHTPMGAQGLNTGIQDAYNLGWKIAQALYGADDRLLDTYEAERLPIAAGVLALSTKKYEALTTLDPSSIRRGKGVQQLAISYRGGPLAPNGGNRTKTLCVGDRAPDAELIDAVGAKSRLFHAFRGPHFTAVAYGARAGAALARLEWSKTGAGLKRVLVDADGGLALLRGTVLADRSHTFRRAYGVAGDALFLVRPDGYLGHLAVDDTLDRSWGAVATLFCSADCDATTEQRRC
jgi:2-polyprenyl-6-methoxyphenol hydroxylase-like FAD-dependent oxidoreductase